MAREGEQPALRRRSREVTSGSHDPYASKYPRPISQADTSPHTDAYRFDEGMIDPPRSNSSSIRMTNTNTQPPRYPGSLPTSSRVPPRRQMDMTKDLPPQMRQSGHTGRQPRLPTMQPQSPSTYASKNVRTTTRTALGPVPVVIKEKPRHHFHWLLPAGVGMVAMLVLWVLGSLALSWGIQQYNNITYGMPRTYQTDAVVGHGDSKANPSHFMAMNWQHQAVIDEMMAGNPSKLIVYVVPINSNGDTDDLAPVTVNFKDLNGDHKPDMIIHVHLSNEDQVSVFINTGTKFRPQTSTDKLTAPIN